MGWLVLIGILAIFITFGVLNYRAHVRFAQKILAEMRQQVSP